MICWSQTFANNVSLSKLPIIFKPNDTGTHINVAESGKVRGNSIDEDKIMYFISSLLVGPSTTSSISGVKSDWLPQNIVLRHTPTDPATADSWARLLYGAITRPVISITVIPISPLPT